MDYKRKILLSSANPLLINIYANELRKSDYGISVVPHADLVVKRIRDMNPDMVILDADGFSSLEKIRRSPEFKGLKVVMLCDSKQESGERIEVPRKIFEKHFVKAENSVQEIAGEIQRILS